MKDRPANNDLMQILEEGKAFELGMCCDLKCRCYWRQLLTKL